MESQSPEEQLLDTIKSTFEKNELVKITLGKPGDKKADLRNIYIRPVEIKNEKLLSFVFRHATKDITKNYTAEEAVKEIETHIKNAFLQANLFTTTLDMQLMRTKKGKSALKVLKPSNPLITPFSHDKIKQRLINTDNNIYLQKLGITDHDFKVIPTMNSKFRQINKFIEIIHSVMPKKLPKKDFKVVDMGSGKGYLTFALYDHLKNTLDLRPEITGVELRPDLVEKCNSIAKASGFENLNFVKNSIRDFDLENPDMLVALHACDTATDEALFKGISSGAGFIIVAPCCHKQVRKAMKPGKALQPVLKHGIYLERQAEILTDGLRGLILEKYGYKIKTLEFISTEHTPKNNMVIAVKTNKIVNKDEIANKIDSLKKMFGIEYHHLELLMEGY